MEKSEREMIDKLAVDHTEFFQNIKCQVYGRGHINRLINYIKINPSICNNPRFRVDTKTCDLLLNKGYITDEGRQLISSGGDGGSNDNTHASLMGSVIAT
jgi:hypothetical protein